MLLMAVLSFLTFFFYSWFVGNMVQDLGMYLLCLLFSSTAFSGVLSLMSAIASKASNNISLMAILSFPVLMPLILVSVKLSKFAIDGIAWSVSFKYLFVLLMLNLTVITLATILFNYLWKD
jgi:heme exporter protein B